MSILSAKGSENMITGIFGPNAYARDQALKIIREKYSDISTERLDGANIDVKDLDSILLGLSLFANEKLLIIRDASTEKQVWEVLQDYIERIPDEVHLVLIDGAPDKRTRTYKLLQKTATIIDCRELDETQLSRWIQERAAELGFTVKSQDARYILSRVGSYQQLLDTELEKLALAQGPITKEVIDDLIEPNLEGSAFALLDAALLQRRPAEVAKQLQMLRAHEDPYHLFGLLVSQVFTLSLVWAAQGSSPDNLARESGLHPFVIKKLSQVASRLTKKQLQTIVEAVATLDDRLKNSSASSADPWELMQTALSSITRA